MPISDRGRGRCDRESAARDLLHAARAQDPRQPFALIALQHERVAFNDAAAPERGLERLEPHLTILRRKTQVLDDGDFLPAATGALETNDRTWNGWNTRRNLHVGHDRCDGCFRILASRHGATGHRAKLFERVMKTHGPMVAGNRRFWDWGLLDLGIWKASKVQSPKSADPGQAVVFGPWTLDLALWTDRFSVRNPHPILQHGRAVARDGDREFRGPRVAFGPGM